MAFQSMALNGAKFLLFRVVFPAVFVAGTVAGIYFQWSTIQAAYAANPILTGNAAAGWFLVGLAFVPVSLRFYQMACVAIILAATVFNVVVGQIELTEMVLVWGGIGVAVSLFLALGALGTTWWKFAQGRFAGDVEDSDT